MFFITRNMMIAHMDSLFRKLGEKYHLLVGVAPDCHGYTLYLYRDESVRVSTVEELRNIDPFTFDPVIKRLVETTTIYASGHHLEMVKGKVIPEEVFHSEESYQAFIHQWIEDMESQLLKALEEEK